MRRDRLWLAAVLIACAAGVVTALWPTTAFASACSGTPTCAGYPCSNPNVLVQASCVNCYKPASGENFCKCPLPTNQYPRYQWNNCPDGIFASAGSCF